MRYCVDTRGEKKDSATQISVILPNVVWYDHHVA